MLENDVEVKIDHGAATIEGAAFNQVNMIHMVSRYVVYLVIMAALSLQHSVMSRQQQNF